MPMLEVLVGSAMSLAVGFAAGRRSRRERVQPSRGAFRTPEAFQHRGREDAVIVIDPLSTGARLAYDATRRGLKVIRVLSSDMPERILSCVPENCKDLAFEATIIYEGDPAETWREIQALPFHVVGCQIGCESGVEVFDLLTEAMPGFPTNGSSGSAARRDKYLMGERVRSAGLRAVKQQECKTWDGDAETFLSNLQVRDSDENGPWCVLKPTKSAGTDGVFIAKSLKEARFCFHKILGTANIFGESNQTVLVQEFLRGTEYVVDSVSLEGQHKCVAVWEYDKRRCNDAQFVYFGMRLYQSDSGSREARMIEYVHGVLDALDVRFGPSHAEVMWLDSEDAPCLVEVGCRPHGGEGTFVDMVEPVIGYSKISVMLDTVEKPYRFHRLPKMPEHFDGAAMEVVLVSREEGTLASYPLLGEVEKLRSFKSMEIKVQVGARLEKTVDFLTTPGSIMLVHQDRKVVEEDCAWIERAQEEGRFYRLLDPMLLKTRMGTPMKYK